MEHFEMKFSIGDSHLLNVKNLTQDEKTIYEKLTEKEKKDLYKYEDFQLQCPRFGLPVKSKSKAAQPQRNVP